MLPDKNHTDTNTFWEAPRFISSTLILVKDRPREDATRRTTSRYPIGEQAERGDRRTSAIARQQQQTDLSRTDITKVTVLVDCYFFFEKLDIITSGIIFSKLSGQRQQKWNQSLAPNIMYSGLVSYNPTLGGREITSRIRLLVWNTTQNTTPGKSKSILYCTRFCVCSWYGLATRTGNSAKSRFLILSVLCMISDTERAKRPFTSLLTSGTDRSQ